MTAIAKLKDRARKHEQKEDWQAAIEAYQKVLETEEGQDEVELELALFNRIGDLYLRLGQTDNAVSYYETAADKYAEAGFFNNAIALCNKALRHRPERAQTYLKLSHLCAEQGFVTDARRWILDYAEREVKSGKVDEAFKALDEFAEMSGDPQIRVLLADQLAAHERPDEAVEQLQKAHAGFTQAGDAEAAQRAADKAIAIDPSVDITAMADAYAPSTDEWDAQAGDESAAEEEPGGTPAGLETRADAGVDEAEPEGVAIEGLEATAAAPDASDAGAEGEGLAGLEVGFSERKAPAAPEEADADSLGGLETFAEFETDEDEVETAGAGVDPVPDAGLEPDADEEAEPLPLVDTGFEDEVDEEAEPLPLMDTGFEDLDDEEEEAEPLPLMDFGDDEAPAAAEAPSEEAGLDLGFEAPDESEPEPAPTGGGDGMEIDFGSFDLGFEESKAPAEEAAVAEDVDADAVLSRARELVSRGLAGEALRELQVLGGGAVGPDVYRQALAVVNEVVRHDANDVTALQRRVEYSARTGDRDLLIDAYVDLADALARLGAETKSVAMYLRVLDLDPDHEAAREAVYGPDAEVEEEEAVDLDAILREMEPEETPSESEEPAGAGDPSFASMLNQFKQRVNENVEAEDAGDHYDLGLAFKEMGLVDEAIAEFQTALTGGEERLKVYEELGQCFMLKGQYNVALKVLARALQVTPEDESELLGVYYHLGKCHEELGHRQEAREAYEKVLALDEDFQDVPERVARL